MFESVERVAADDAVGCADRLAALVVEQRRIGASRLAYVAHWADLHAPVGTVGVRPGADGTPMVTPAAVTELGMLVQTTTHSARLLLADALDLRHRLPRCWQASMTGEVEDYKARYIARLTRAADLTLEQARQVDSDAVAGLKGLPWGRAMEVVEAAIVRADPAGHERRRAAAEHDRYVATSRRDTETGLRTLIARTTVGDVARFDAMVAHIAELLDVNGDPDSLQLRRAKAFAVLADPAAACLLLARGHDVPSSGSPAGRDCNEREQYFDDEPHEQHVSAVDAASELGRVLLAQGATALARLRPRTVVYLHLTEAAVRARSGVARAEGIGPVSLDQCHHLHELLGRDAVTVKPVIDPAGQTPVDAYEVPASMREALQVRHPYEVFPWGTLPSRAADLDHTAPYRDPGDGGPPAQTRPDNLGPLSRSHHNAKTHHGFALYQPTPGVYLWRTPTGHWYQVDADGSHALGRAVPLPQRSPMDQVRSPLEARFAGLMAS